MIENALPFLLDRRRGWVIAWLLIAVAGSAWIAASRAPSGAVAVLAPAPRPGFPAPDFTLASVDGTTWQLADLRGRPVVLNFWASWCDPCRIETPTFQALHAELGADVVFLGINQAEQPAQIAAFADHFNLTYPLLLDPDAAVNRTYGVTGLPTTLFIRPDGTVESVIPGAVNQAVLRERVQRLLSP